LVTNRTTPLKQTFKALSKKNSKIWERSRLLKEIKANIQFTHANQNQDKPFLITTIKGNGMWFY
jgi:hypothetical protein